MGTAVTVITRLDYLTFLHHLSIQPSLHSSILQLRMAEYKHTMTVCILYLLLLPAVTLGRTTESPVCQDNGCETYYGGDAECVNVRHGNWSQIGRQYVLGSVDKERLCQSQHHNEDCCRCLPIRTTTTTTTPTTTTTTTTSTTTTSPAVCTDVQGSCRAAFNGSGSCIDVRQGDLTYIDIDVDPLDGHCSTGPEHCCECFKMKTEGSNSNTMNTIMTTTTTSTNIRGPIMAIGGFNSTSISSAEVLTTSCDFPLPEGRRGHMSVTTADGKILVCGGQTSSERTASCLQFNFQSKTWEHHSSLENKWRLASSAIALKHGVYILGGGKSPSKSSEFLA